MPTPSAPPILFVPPSDAEAAALAVVVAYLTRAGTEAASRLLVTRLRLVWTEADELPLVGD